VRHTIKKQILARASTAYRIEEGDFERWYKEWLKTAQRVHRYAVTRYIFWACNKAFLLLEDHVI
jgi:hypothetical protein